MEFTLPIIQQEQSQEKWTNLLDQVSTDKSRQEKWEEEIVVQQPYIQGWVGFYLDQ